MAVHGSLLQAQLLEHLHVPYEILGDGGILIGGHAVDAAVHAAGVPVAGGDQLHQAGGVFSQLIGDVQVSADFNVLAQVAAVAEDDVIGFTGGDDDVAAGAPIAPADALDLQLAADLLFDVGIQVGDPGVVVLGLAVAQGDDLDGRHFLGSREGGHAQHHAQCQNEGQELLHMVLSF